MRRPAAHTGNLLASAAGRLRGGTVQEEVVTFSFGENWSDFVDHLVARPRHQQLAPDAGHLVGLAHPTEQMEIGGRLPRPEPGADRRYSA